MQTQIRIPEPFRQKTFAEHICSAFHMYADSSIYSEYDCIERVAKDYQDRCKEPTVTITWSECNDFEDGEVIPLAEANKRFEFTR